MSKNDKFYMPKYTTAELIHIGTIISKYPGSNRCDVVLDMIATSNGNGVTHALLACYVTPNDDFKYEVLYCSGSILRDAIKYKRSGNTIDIYCSRAGIQLLVSVRSIGSQTSFDLKVSLITSLPSEVQGIIVE